MSASVMDAPEGAPHAPAGNRPVRLPRWATASDFIASLAIVVALAVVIGGGFRVRVGALRLAVTSPLTPLLVALLLVGVRHWIHRRPNILARYGVRAAAVLRSEAWQATWRPFVATRLGLIAVGLLAVYTVGYPPGEPRVRTSDSELLNLPMRWDAGWYYSVTRLGYHWDRRDTGQQNIAFFPAYPMLTRALARLFGGSDTTFIVAAVAMSHAAFLWGLLLLYQLARSTLGDDGAARAAVLLAACYPFSIYYGAIYTESLFLLGAVGAILEFQRARWGRAIAWGVLVGLTRPNGFLLAATLAVLAVDVWRRDARRSPTRSWLLPAAAALAPVAGATIFSIYIGALTGNPLEWSAQHAAWGRTFAGTEPLVASAEAVADTGALAFLAARPYDVMNGAAALCAVALIIPVGLRLGLAYAVFLAVNLLPPLLLGGTMSMGRITSTMFPLFLWLAAIAPRSTTSLAAAFALFQGFIGVLFYTWRPLF